ncbi:hypothetical protein EVAR_23691_1 [Eumeta japonica]|uniref:Uncharacterized protein n=1 Tax=Eumeta variegata TaxID=151549 RepID=A0A4C1VKT9_EUMVA|nr:hypothetical protein EVAR_23691_1 [Eumeta japonica]
MASRRRDCAAACTRHLSRDRYPRLSRDKTPHFTCVSRVMDESGDQTFPASSPTPRDTTSPSLPSPRSPFSYPDPPFGPFPIVNESSGVLLSSPSPHFSLSVLSSFINPVLSQTSYSYIRNQQRIDDSSGVASVHGRQSPLAFCFLVAHNAHILVMPLDMVGPARGALMSDLGIICALFGYLLRSSDYADIVLRYNTAFPLQKTRTPVITYRSNECRACGRAPAAANMRQLSRLRQFEWSESVPGGVLSNGTV